MMRKRAIRFLTSAVGLMVMAGCGGNGGNHTYQESQWLTADAGSVLYRGGLVSLTVSANAVSTNTKVTLYSPPVTAVPFDRAILADTEYEFRGGTLASAGTIALSYDPSDIPAGYSKSSLQVVRISNGAWAIQSATADATNSRFTFTTTTPGIYAIRIANFAG